MENIVKYLTDGSVCTFSAEDFADAYSNSELIPISAIKIESLPPEEDGTLKISGDNVNEAMIITYDLLSELAFYPSEGFSGETSFTISATDDRSYSNNALVRIVYSSDMASDVPITSPFSVSCEKNTPVHASLSYSYSGNEELTYMIVSVPERGEVEMTGGGDFVYTPFTDQTGNDSFSFKVISPAGESNISTCTITITEPEYTPIPTSEPLSFVYRDMITHWGNYSAVKMVEAGIMKGERIGSKYYFYPDKVLTRLDCINYLLSTLYADPDETPDNIYVFADSDNYPDYVNAAAAKAYELGIIEGSVGSDGRIYLNPFNHVTRAEFIKMIDTSMGEKINSRNKVEFDDSNTIPEWAYQHIQNMLGYGIIQGYTDNTIRPFNSVTKAEATEMLYQMLKYNSSETTAKSVLSHFARIS
ncbi:MAG: S-layer homology domain-containing protein [Oscillospiraceae bacterium]|nr:S-layer homology domain-containing protein [Oscillospiraceae bacterium]